MTPELARANLDRLPAHVLEYTRWANRADAASVTNRERGQVRAARKNELAASDYRMLARNAASNLIGFASIC